VIFSQNPWRESTLDSALENREEPPVDERSIFMAALSQETPAQRSAFLDEACGGDPALRQRVEALLASHEQAGSFLGMPLPQRLAEKAPKQREQTRGAAPAASEPPRPLPEGPGSRIGPYKLLQEIGEGGMGTVYLAEQNEPVRRLVALKIIKPGMDSRQVIARFEAERQALALMDHPNIAKVLDAGQTGERREELGDRRDNPDARGLELGVRSQAESEVSPSPNSSLLTPLSSSRPYFVMELVKGVPITKFCDEQRLTPRQRLELFVPVCQAVQHAHQKGIIHRDLKPSNVMVCLYDGRPVPKVIDFGVAKATGQKLTERTMFTEIGQVVGTLEYMSPEQAELNQLDVDTRSDIYSLGVLLYELLTGSTPLERKRLKSTAMLEVLRLIREEEPPRPSTRLSESKETLPAISAQRQTEPARLTKLVRGELDWIVMKALEKDRNRRYETANGFAMDVQRYLADEPVQACPPSVGYRLRKFLRRYKGPVLAASAILFLLAAGIVGTTMGLLWALDAEREMRTQRDQKDSALKQTKIERDQKEEARRAAVAAAEEEARARRQTQRALNMMTDEIVEEHLGQQPQLTGRQREFLKKVLAEHEMFAAAKADDAEGRKSRAEGLVRVGRIRFRLGAHEEGMAAFSAAAAAWKQLQGDFPDRPEFRFNEASSHRSLGILRRDTGHLKEAESAFNDALTILKPLADDFKDRPEFRFQLAATHVDLGILLKETTDRLKEAGEHYEAALPLFAQLVKGFPRQPDYRNGLAFGYNSRGSLMWAIHWDDKAESDYRAALDIRKQLVKEFPERIEYRQHLALSYNLLGIVLHANLQWKEAEAVYRAALDIYKKLVDQYPGRPDFQDGLAKAYHNLGNLLLKGNRLKEAETAYLDALPIRKELVKKFPDRPDFRQALAVAHNSLGLVLKGLGRPKDATAAYGDALTVQRQLVADFGKVPDYHHQLAGTLGNLARLHLENKEFADAVPLIDEALPHNRAAVAANPKNPDYGRFYRNNLWTLCQCILALRDHARLATTAEALARLGYLGSADVYFGSQFLSRCVALAEKDPRLDEARRTELTQNYTDRALVLLRQAVAGGSIDADGMKKDRSYDPLRARAGFKKLLAEVEEKAKK
jgi:serine/threonine protein kinase/tetratricopeptide (TPR) repeat protein